MIKLVAIDIDGTLLKSDGTISNENIKAIKLARSNNIKVILCTGRPYSTAKEVLKLLNYQLDDYLITMNGALLQKLDGTILFNRTLDYEDFLFVYNKFNSIPAPLTVIDHEFVYINNEYSDNVKSLYPKRSTNAPFKYIDFLDFNSENIFNKFTLAYPEEELDYIQSILDASIIKKYNVIRSEPEYLEILNKKASKESTLIYLANALGLKMTEVATIGNEMNDYQMLKISGMGFAVANSSPPLLSIADRIVSANDDDGVTEAIRHLILHNSSLISNTK